MPLSRTQEELLRLIKDDVGFTKFLTDITSNLSVKSDVDMNVSTGQSASEGVILERNDKNVTCLDDIIQYAIENPGSNFVDKMSTANVIRYL